MRERFRLYCKHSYYRWVYGMELSLPRLMAAHVWKLLWAPRLPSVYRPRR